MLTKVYALEVDEKLTLRILKMSKTKKTILINRGKEDGLKVGDHAKFFNQLGVLARAVVVKVSPMRSVWSVYRINNDKEIKIDTVMNLKITTELSLSSDKTREVKEVVIPSGVEVLDKQEEKKTDEKTPEKKPEQTSKAQAEYFLRNMDTFSHSLGQGRGLLNWSPWEVTGSFSYISTQTTYVDGARNYSNEVSNFELTLGLERYFPHQKNLVRQFSLVGYLEWVTTSIGNETFWDGALPKDLFGLGLGTHWHMSDPFKLNKAIGFLSLYLGLGGRKFTSVVNGQAFEDNVSFFSWSLGGGFKWYTKSGLGLRAIFEYVSRQEDSTIKVNGNYPAYTSNGPRLKFGASWRF
jgi:hypothetical protein